MRKEKKIKVGRLAGVALLLTMVTTCLLSSTLAKYTTALAGTDKARVAAWKFSSDNLGDPDTQTIDVFSTVYNNTNGDETVKSMNGDKVIAPGTSGSFTLEYNLVSEVTTRIVFNVEESQTPSGAIPLVYKYGNDYYSDVTFLNADPYLNLTNTDGTSTFTQVTITGTLYDMAEAMTGTTTIDAATAAAAGATGIDGDEEIQWFWAFEEDKTSTAGGDLTDRDSSDTLMGQVAADELIDGTGTAAIVELKITATATQVD